MVRQNRELISRSLEINALRKTCRKQQELIAHLQPLADLYKITKKERDSQQAAVVMFAKALGISVIRGQCVERVGLALILDELMKSFNSTSPNHPS